MNPTDEKLRALLNQWREIEPGANFEANVRRRVRLAAPETPEQISWLAFLLRPVYALATAAAIGIVAGMAGGVHSVSHRPPAAEFGILGDDTLAGGYAKLSEARVR